MNNTYQHTLQRPLKISTGGGWKVPTHLRDREGCSRPQVIPGHDFQISWSDLIATTVEHGSNMVQWPGKNRLKISVTPKNLGDVTMIAVHYSATRRSEEFVSEIAVWPSHVELGPLGISHFHTFSNSCSQPHFSISNSCSQRHCFCFQFAPSIVSDHVASTFQVNKGPGHEDMNFDINHPMDTSDGLPFTF